MSHCRIVGAWLFAMALMTGACTNGGSSIGGGGAPSACEDLDHDGFGLGCARGPDCDDRDAKITHECRTCARPEYGCPCADEGALESCFLPARELPEGKLQCSEGTRVCRAGSWSGCESVHEYVLDKSAQTQQIIVPNAGRETCDSCDLKCFKVKDDLLIEGGVAGGTVTFGPNGGLTLLPGDGGVVDSGGPVVTTGCAGLTACCETLAGPAKNACQATVALALDARCDSERATYCPSGPITGPVPNCTLGTGADVDCDGIPNAVDEVAGKPFPTTANQTIFHELDVGETGTSAINISFKLNNADVYFLLDTTGTMIDERDNLVNTLTTGNVVNCAQLSGCCGTDSTCTGIVSANNQTTCATAQVTYCGGPVDCADADLDGAPDNGLKTQGVVGAVRCLVGTSWFGTGFFREIPAHKESEPTPVFGEGQRYGDRDEVVFRHLIDMSPDYDRVRVALRDVTMNYNWDEPEGGFMGLYSLVTGKGHYFGINRPAVPDRSAAQGCGVAGAFGYACFRPNAVPIVVYLTDRPSHNGPGDATTEPTNCEGRGAGCPYSDLTSLNSWTSGATESASDKTAHYVAQTAEGFSTAYPLGDVRGKYFTLVGNTTGMAGDYPGSIIGCSAANDAPDTLITFRVGPGGSIPVNLHLTKNDAYDGQLYGRWNPSWLPSGSDDPTPATEFGAVVSLFRGIPSAVSTTQDVMDKVDNVVASGPDGAYLSYQGTTAGSMSKPGLWGGISGCAADGQTNQVSYTFRPGADARIVFDATTSAFPVSLSLHQGKPSALPSNPTPSGITNDNDTFSTAHAVLSGSNTIDGNYAENAGDSSVASVHADYTTRHTLTMSGARTNGSALIKGLTHPELLYVGLPLSNSTGWSGTPVSIASINGNQASMTATWLGTTDAFATSIDFDDTLVGCNADPAARETVFKFDVATPRKVRIDTEGSSFDTVISLHDGQPATAVTRNDVSGNGVAPGYDLAELTSKVYTLNDVGTGTTSLPNTYDFVQCGAAAASNDAVFRFTLNRATRIGLDVASSAWDPVVGLFSAVPGAATTLVSTNTNDRAAPLDVGNVLGQVSTKVTGSSLTGMVDDFLTSAVGCGALASPNGRDQIFKFTPSGSTTVRITATPGVAGFYPVVAVFDGPPPATAVPLPTQAFDASTVTLPDSNCQAFSYHDASMTTAHVYTACPTRRYSDEADGRCMSAGMDHLAIVDNAGEQAFLASLVANTTTTYGHHIGAKIASGATFSWRDGLPLAYTNWASGEPNEPAQTCAAMQKAGRWEDKRCTSSSAAADDQTFYLCEDTTPVVVPAEDNLTAQTVDPRNTVVSLQGSTLRMHDDYNAATLMGGCGGTVGAGDAVFKIVTGGAGFVLSADTAGSSYSPVIGLFDGSIDGTGYLACDAAGGAPLTQTLLPSRTYYIVVDGTAASPEGSYKLKLSDTTVASTGSRLVCGTGSMVAPAASVDVEVDANHTYYVVTDTSTATVGAYTLQLNALYQARTTVANTNPTNERGVSAYSLPDPYRSKITVVDTTTGGMAGDYASGTVCSGATSSPDAVYKLRPSQNTGLKISVNPKGVGLTTPVIGLFDGAPPTTPVVHDLAADGNPNEAFSSAEVVSFGSSTQRYDGNTSGMSNDTDISLGACGSASGGRDAMFAFSLASATTVEIDASASSITNPVVRLFKDGPMARPSAVALTNDDRAAANANPASPALVDGQWLQYSGDLALMTSDGQTQSSAAATNSDGPAQDLGDVAGRRVTVGGGDTSSLTADYPGTCGAADGGKDAIYKFQSSTATRLHVKANPASGYDAVLSLYEGPNGPPARLIDTSTLTEDNTCSSAMSPTAPRNLTRTLLQTIAPDIAGAVDVDLNCATPNIDTTDPDGAGPGVVTFNSWCNATPTAYVQSQAGGPDAVVLLMHTFHVQAGSTLRISGSRPVIFVVTDDATIEGTVNASGDQALATLGPGGNIACGASAGGDAGTAAPYSGGGGGGGFATAGGLGGTGVNGTLAAGSAGAARGNASLVPLLGGCSGGHSGGAFVPGFAGGAVQISALGDLVVSGGVINANGGNGASGTFNVGGTGGGSGGALLLEGATLAIDPGALRVNGGNGGNAAGGAVAGAGSTNGSTSGGNGAAGSATQSGAGGGGGFGRTVTQVRTLSLAPCGPFTFENAGSALALDVDSSGRESIELGDTSVMTHDHDVTSCGASATAHDAVYAFTLSKKSDIRIDASASPNTTVVGLFDASGLIAGSAALGCANSGNGLSLTSTLPAGDYRIVVTSATPAGGSAFAVHVQNMNFAATAAPRVACDSAGELLYDLSANTPYYLIVKGRTAVQSGAYGLVVETAGTGPSMGCGASPASADAVYKFSLASQRAVSIDTEGSSFDTVLAVYPSSATAFDTNYAIDAFGVQVSCDDNGSATPLLSRIDATLAAGNYYVVVKRKLFSWSSASQPFQLSIRDASLTSALSCASASIGGKKILQMLPAGDYHVVVSGETVAGGAYSVKFRDVSNFGLENGVQLACVSGAGNALTYNAFQADHDYYVVVKGNAATESGAYEMTVEDTVSLSAAAGSTAVACAAEGSKIDGVYPAGTYYALVSGKSATENGPYTLHVQDLDSQNDGNRLACDDNSGPNKSSAIEANLAAGTHYVVVKGKTVLDKGGYRVRVRDLDTVQDHRLACAGGSGGPAHLEYDVKAGKDYTLLLLGSDPTAEGNYALNMYDSVSSPSASGSRLQCASDPQPTPLRNSNWDTRSLDFTTTLAPDTYYVAVKGVRATDEGSYQLQIGEKTARTQTTYNPPTWPTTRDALVASGVHVLPVIATQGDTADFVTTGEAQAKLLAAATGSVRADGTPIWQKINEDGSGTGTGLVKAIAELATHLAMDVSLTAIDGPDPGATLFKISVTPQNSPSCESPHPLVDATGACSGAPGVYNCNTQYKCRPGAAPKFKVSFTNPTSAPVPPNPNNPYGGYLFKLQLKGDGKYLLDEIPVFIIPTTKMLPPPPGTYQTAGVYQQDVDATSCKLERQPNGTFQLDPRSTDLPQWRDLYFKADIPDGASIDFELCTADTQTALNSCLWSDSPGGTRTKVTVTARGDCVKDADCVNVPGKGNGFCSDYGTCEFIDKPKVLFDSPCSDDSKCENGLFGAGDYVISSHCEKNASAYGYGHCVYHSVPVDIGSTLLPGEDGKLYSRVRIKLHSNLVGNATPTLYEWYMTYRCQSAL